MRAISNMTPAAIAQLQVLIMQHRVPANLSTPITDLINEKRQLQQIVLTRPVEEWPNLAKIFEEPLPPHNVGPRTRDTSMDPPLLKIFDVLKHDFRPLMQPPFFANAPFKLQIPKEEQWMYESTWRWATKILPDKWPAKTSPHAANFFKVEVALGDAFGATVHISIQ